MHAAIIRVLTVMGFMVTKVQGSEGGGKCASVYGLDDGVQLFHRGRTVVLPRGLSVCVFGGGRDWDWTGDYLSTTTT